VTHGVFLREGNVKSRRQEPDEAEAYKKKKDGSLEMEF
jgi:hypothetical protein